VVRVPGVLDTQRWITDDCRARHGDSGAAKEAIESAHRAVATLLDAWPVGKGTRIYVTVTVDPPPQPARLTADGTAGDEWGPADRDALRNTAGPAGDDCCSVCADQDCNLTMRGGDWYCDDCRLETVRGADLEGLVNG
jgi:hypothetical protein